MGWTDWKILTSKRTRKHHEAQIQCWKSKTVHFWATFFFFFNLERTWCGCLHWQNPNEGILPICIVQTGDISPRLIKKKVPIFLVPTLIWIPFKTVQKKKPWSLSIASLFPLLLFLHHLQDGLISSAAACPPQEMKSEPFLCFSGACRRGRVFGACVYSRSHFTSPSTEHLSLVCV